MCVEMACANEYSVQPFRNDTASARVRWCRLTVNSFSASAPGEESIPRRSPRLNRRLNSNSVVTDQVSVMVVRRA